MEKALALALVIVTLCIPVCADSNGVDLSKNVGEWIPSGYASVTWQQKYIGLRVSREFYDDSMLWKELQLNLPANFFLNLWWSNDLQDWDLASSSGDEFDITIGWQTKVFGLDLMTSASQYTCLPNPGFWGEGHALSGDVIMSRTIPLTEKQKVTPALWVGYLSMNTSLDGSSIYVLPNVKHNWVNPFGIEQLTFSQTLMFPWDNGFMGNDPDGWFVRWMPALNWKLSKHLTLTAPSAIILEPIIKPHDGRDSATSLNFSLTYDF